VCKSNGKRGDKSQKHAIEETILVSGRTLCGKGSTLNPKLFYMEPKGFYLEPKWVLQMALL
jgi:hypothetical protein